VALASTDPAREVGEGQARRPEWVGHRVPTRCNKEDEMRKLLLASAAMAGATTWLTPAFAQPTAMPMMPTQGMYATQPSASPPAGANNNNNTNVIAAPGAVANPTPGTVVIHINGRVTSNLNATWSSLDRGTFPAQTALGATIVPAGTFKVEPINLSTYARIYTGLDAMAANGLRYGGAIEVRNNFTGSNPSNASTGASGYSSSETFFIRRAFLYVAADNVGLVRVGQGDGLISLYDNGVTSFQFLPSGNLNGGDLQANFPGNVSPPFAFSTVAGNEYTYQKIVYMSPQFAGFDFGVSWGPTSTNGYGSGTTTTFGTLPGCPVAGSACPDLSSSSIAGDSARTLNLTQVGVRYQGKFDALGILAYGVYMFSGHASYTGPHIATAQTFTGLSLGNVGVAVTFGGFTVGGNWIGGAVNGQIAPKPDGGADTQAWLAGVTYKTGPLLVGVTGMSINSQGSPALTGKTQRYEYGFDAGASYTIAPGLVGWAEYLYQSRKQNGFNFATGATGAAFNNVHSQGVEIGTTVYW
jgi:hypothetical protein